MVPTCNRDGWMIVKTVIIVSLFCRYIYFLNMIQIFYYTLCLLGLVLSSDVLSLTNNGPAVRGARVTFTAVIHNYDNEGGKLIFWDDAQPQHEAEISVTSNTTKWIVEYNKDLYEAKLYTIQVDWESPSFLPIVWESAITILNLTDKNI